MKNKSIFIAKVFNVVENLLNKPIEKSTLIVANKLLIHLDVNLNNEISFRFGTTYATSQMQIKNTFLNRKKLLKNIEKSLKKLKKINVDLRGYTYHLNFSDFIINIY